MSVAAFCRVVQSQWQAFSQYVWPETARERVQAEIDRLTQDLARRYRLLVRRRRKIEALRDRIAQFERELPADSSLHPHHLLRARERNRRRLEELEARYTRLRSEYLRRKQLRLDLARGHLVVCDDPIPDMG